MVKVKKPALFCGKRDASKAFVYAETDGIRYNVIRESEIDPDGEIEPEGCAGYLVEAEGVDPSEYRELPVRTKNPQKI